MLEPIFLDNIDSISQTDDQFQPYGQEFLPVYTQSTDQNILIQSNLDEAYKSLATELISIETNQTKNYQEESYGNIEAPQENNKCINQQLNEFLKQDDCELRDQQKSIEFMQQDDQNYQIEGQHQQQLPDIASQRLENEENLPELQIQGNHQQNAQTNKSNEIIDNKIEQNEILNLNTQIQTKKDHDSDPEEQIIEENPGSNEQIQINQQNQCLDEFDEFEEAQSAQIIQQNNEIISNKIYDGQEIFNEFEEAQSAPIINLNGNEIIQNKIYDGQNEFQESQSAPILQDNETILNKNLDDSILIEEFEVAKSAPLIQDKNIDIIQNEQTHLNKNDQVQQAQTINQNGNINGDHLNSHEDEEFFDEFEEAQLAPLYNDNANQIVQSTESSACQLVQSDTIENNKNDDHLDEFDEFEEAHQAEIQSDQCSNPKIYNQEDEFDEFDEFEEAQQEIKNEQIPNHRNGMHEELKHSNNKTETSNQNLNLLSKNESQIKALFGQFVQFREIKDQFVDANEFEEKISSYNQEFCIKMQKENFWNDSDRIKKPYRSTWKDFQMKGMVYAALGISEMELVHLDRTPAQTETEIRIPKQNHHHLNHQSSLQSMQHIKKNNYPHPVEQENPIEKILQSLPDYSFIFNKPSQELLQKIVI